MLIGFIRQRKDLGCGEKQLLDALSNSSASPMAVRLINIAKAIDAVVVSNTS